MLIYTELCILISTTFFFYEVSFVLKRIIWDVCTVQSVKRLTLDLSSGLDLRVMSSSPMLGSVLGMKPT